MAKPVEKVAGKRKRWLWTGLTALTAVAALFALLPGISGNVQAEIEGIYTYSVAGGAATITKCSQNASGSLTVPAELGGVPVTRIGGSAFYACEELTSVRLPDGVTRIGDYAFAECCALKRVTLPAGLTALGDGVFWNCEALTSAVLPEGLETIGANAFCFCGALTSLTIPASVTSIGEGAFFACASLRKLSCDAANPNYSAAQGILYDAGRARLLAAPGVLSAEIPPTVTEIGPQAFAWNTALTEVSVPPSVTVIGEEAFANCSNLTSATLSEGLETIGAYAFDGAGLTAVTVPGSLTDMGAYAFSNCPDLAAAALEPGAALGENAFSGCPALTSVSLPDGLSEIGAYAFYQCTALKTVVIPGGTVRVGEGAFAQCAALTRAEIRPGVKEIGRSAFSLCEALRSVTIPSSVTVVEAEAFYGCSALTQIYCQAAAKPAGWSEDWALYCPACPEAIRWKALLTPTVTAKASAAGVRLSWNAVPRATKYNVYRKTSSTSWEAVGYARTTLYLDETAAVGTVYSYRVRPQVSTDYGDYSRAVSACVLSAPSAAAENAADGVRLSWDPVAGAKLYYVWRAEGDGVFAKIGSASGTVYTDKTAVGGTKYRYQVKARYKSCYSAPSEAVTQRYLTVPEASVKAYASGIKVTWTESPGATKYNLYRAGADGKLKKIGYSRTLAYVDRTVESGQVYEYRVAAQVSVYWSARSEPVRATAR